MTSYRLAVASVLLLLPTCVGQSKRGDPWGELDLIGDILGAAHVSGSLAYSGCGFLEGVPDDPPPMRVLSDHSGPAKGVLQRIFADDPRMQVTQEGGIVRMMETDVPKDLLEFKIHHLSFPYDHGPIVAMEAILHTYEVRHFRMEHNIGPEAEWGSGFPWPGNENPERSRQKIPGIPGVLNDVTVAQALDYVTMTFPGFWSYESCVSKEGRRSAHFSFLERPPSPWATTPKHN